MANSRTEPESNKHPFNSAHFGLWLSWQELNGRKVVFFINVMLIALFLALAVSVDFMGKARASSVDRRIDYMGPSISLVPNGVRSSDLVKAQLKNKTFPYEDFSVLKTDFGYLLRASEVRLITRMTIGGKSVPVVGIDVENVYSYPFSKYSIHSDEILLGSLLSSRLNKVRGDVMRIGSLSYTTTAIIETTGGIDDLSIFMSLPVLQRLIGKEGLINEIRLFPRSAMALDELKKRLENYHNNLNVIDSSRGEVAEKNIDATLGDYQKVVYGAASILIALCIMISTYINIEGRKPEMSTVYTLGATKGIIFQVLAYRTLWIALAGSLVGHVLSLVVLLLQDYRVPLLHIWSWRSFMLVVLGTIILGLFVTTPFALYSVYKSKLTEHL